MTNAYTSANAASPTAEPVSLEAATDIAARLHQTIASVIYGQDDLITEALTCLIGGGHI